MCTMHGAKKRETMIDHVKHGGLEHHWYLDRVNVLEAVTPDQRAELVQQSMHRRFSTGYIIFSPGEKARSVYILQKGRIKIFGITRGGHEVVYWRIYPGDVFGLAEICGDSFRECFAEAAADSIAVEIPKQVFENLLKTNCEISFQFIKVLGSRLRQATEIIKSMSGDRVEQRLATHLLKLGQISGVQRPNGEILINERHTHQEIADSIGSTRQTVSESLGKFRSSNLIKVERGHIILLAVPQLHELAK